mmetsp:Transcript_37104/g.86271  ORF Transcript_37104/g.86271 Transcript_37104/m.86271 type:complete len:234 (+) Transcript_37104:146-847(+)
MFDNGNNVGQLSLSCPCCLHDDVLIVRKMKFSTPWASASFDLELNTHALLGSRPRALCKQTKCVGELKIKSQCVVSVCPTERRIHLMSCRRPPVSKRVKCLSVCLLQKTADKELSSDTHCSEARLVYHTWATPTNQGCKPGNGITDHRSGWRERYDVDSSVIHNRTSCDGKSRVDHRLIHLPSYIHSPLGNRTHSALVSHPRRGVPRCQEVRGYFLGAFILFDTPVTIKVESK